MSLPEAHALELLNRYYITRIDREVCGDDFQTAYKAATRACLEAMSVNPRLLALAKKYASECADCDGSGEITNCDDSGLITKGGACPDCKDIREVIAMAPAGGDAEHGEGVLDLLAGPSDLRAVPARACGCPDDGDGHYGTCLLSREEP